MEEMAKLKEIESYAATSAYYSGVHIFDKSPEQGRTHLRRHAGYITPLYRTDKG
jgi:hypothetical protein